MRSIRGTRFSLFTPFKKAHHLPSNWTDSDSVSNADSRPRIYYLNTSLPIQDRRGDFDTLWHDINGNSGNGYIAWAVAKQLKIPNSINNGIRNIFKVSGNELDRAAEQIERDYDAVFLFLQDTMRADLRIENSSALVEFIKRLKKPLVVFSLGCNSFDSLGPKKIFTSLDKSCKEFIEAILDKAESVGVRGNLSGQVLDCFGSDKYAIVGCPTWYEEGPTRNLKQRSWDPTKGVAATGLFSNNAKIDIYYFLQSERSLVHALLTGRKIRDIDDMAIDHQYPFHAECLLNSISKEQVFFFIDPEAWKRRLQEVANIAIGTRVHGSIIAINAGIPAICTNGDSRAREMCDLFKIPLLPGACFYDMNVEKIFDEFPFEKINREYNKLYANYENWLSLTLDKIIAV